MAPLYPPLWRAYIRQTSRALECMGRKLGAAGGKARARGAAAPCLPLEPPVVQHAKEIR